jgi:DNA topoisomerase VI subunit A
VIDMTLQEIEKKLKYMSEQLKNLEIIKHIASENYEYLEWNEAIELIKDMKVEIQLLERVHVMKQLL